jgi:hypothetical protein
MINQERKAIGNLARLYWGYRVRIEVLATLRVAAFVNIADGSISGHLLCNRPYPLFSQKRTLAGANSVLRLDSP